MPEVFQCAVDSRVTPRRIFTRDSNRALANFLHDARPSHAPSPGGPLARKKAPVPPQDRLWRDQRRHFAQGPPPETVAFRRQSAPLGIGHPQALPTQLFFEAAALPSSSR